jgi:hypothetical protein
VKDLIRTDPEQTYRPTSNMSLRIREYTLLPFRNALTFLTSRERTNLLRPEVNIYLICYITLILFYRRHRQSGTPYAFGIVFQEAGATL